MIQIKGLTITHKKDLRTILEDFRLVLNDGDKAVIIGEEGNGKSTLMKWIYDPDMVEKYAECEGERVLRGERLGYLPQELPTELQKRTVYEFFAGNDSFYDRTPKELAALAGRFQVEEGFFYSAQLMESLSGGEKIKAQLMRLLLEEPTVLLLDEPSNDIDIQTLELLEDIIKGWKQIVLFISHDETLIENTANMVIHLEQIQRKQKCRHCVVKMPYRQYMAERERNFERQEQQAVNERLERKKQDERFRRIYRKLENAQDTVSRQCPGVAAGLKRKVHTLKAMERRFERENARMTERPEQEEAIFFKLGSRENAIPAGKTVIEYELRELLTPDGTARLAAGISLRVRGSQKICIVGKNGAGKTTLLKKIAEELLKREDIAVEYMPQNYEELLDMEQTPVDFLDRSGDKEERTRIRTYLGALKYTADEMSHPIRELSGGQKAKVILLKMSLSNANVLILDEPTRNFSPLSGPVIRRMIKEFPGAVICISHDRKFIAEVSDKVYELTEGGLAEGQVNGWQGKL